MKDTSFGTYIRTLRLGCGLTQQALADQLHVTDKAVSKWERDLSYPDIRLLSPLAEVLGIGISDLIRVISSEKSPSGLVEQYEKSSDLSTPLHIILGCANLLETYYDDPEKSARYLEAIRISGEYLLSMLDIRDHSPDRISPGNDSCLRGPGPSSECVPPASDYKGSRKSIAEDVGISSEIINEIL